MAIGFSPSASRPMPLNHFVPRHFVALASHIAQEAGWLLLQFSEQSFEARTSNAGYTHNAIISFEIEDGTVYLNSRSAGNEMFDRGQNKRNLDRFETLYYASYRLFSPDDLEQRFQELTTAAPDEMPQEASASALKNRSQGFQWRKPSRIFCVTPTLIALNLLVYLVMSLMGAHWMEPSVESLIQWGGNLRHLTLEGESWRLLSCMFLHIGLVHLLFNMAALFYIGALLEPKLGSWRFATAYLLTGLLSSLASLWMHAYQVSAGASGAIFGLYGVYLALLTSNFIDKRERQLIFQSIALFVLYNLVGGMDGKTDNAGHIGGLLCGIAMGYLLVPSLSAQPYTQGHFKARFGGVAVMLTLVGLAWFAVFRFTSVGGDLEAYQQKIKDFAEMESMALEVYRHYGDNSEMINEIKGRSDYYWKENLAITDEIDDMELPVKAYKINGFMREYCSLHLKMNELLCKSLSEHTTQYQAQIDSYRAKIEKITNNLKDFSQEASLQP